MQMTVTCTWQCFFPKVSQTTQLTFSRNFLHLEDSVTSKGETLKRRNSSRQIVACYRQRFLFCWITKLQVCPKIWHQTCTAGEALHRKYEQWIPTSRIYTCTPAKSSAGFFTQVTFFTCVKLACSAKHLSQFWESIPVKVYTPPTHHPQTNDCQKRTNTFPPFREFPRSRFPGMDTTAAPWCTCTSPMKIQYHTNLMHILQQKHFSISSTLHAEKLFQNSHPFCGFFVMASK